MKNKLVRDKIPGIIRDAGKVPYYHREKDKKKILKLLKNKLIEEAKEVRDATSSGEMIMELADVYEVLITLAKQYNVSIDFIKYLAKEKREKNGGFKENIVLHMVISQEQEKDVDQFIGHLV